ncbi:hypothetical protein LTR78_000059, partial [Recurvomyces mirabilis]
AIQLKSDRMTHGPPTIDIIWNNLNRDRENSSWTLSRGPTGPSIDKLCIRIAKLVEDGWIALHLVAMTEYTCVVTCTSTATEAEFRRVAWGHEG